MPRPREGIGRLHFAGEHVSTAFVGFMEGGLASGVAAARRVAERAGVVAERGAAEAAPARR